MIQTSPNKGMTEHWNFYLEKELNPSRTIYLGTTHPDHKKCMFFLFIFLSAAVSFSKECERKKVWPKKFSFSPCPAALDAMHIDRSPKSVLSSSPRRYRAKLWSRRCSRRQREMLFIIYSEREIEQRNFLIDQLVPARKRCPIYRYFWSLLPTFELQMSIPKMNFYKWLYCLTLPCHRQMHLSDFDVNN